MKKSTERKRIKRMSGDARRLFLHGLITAPMLTTIKKALAIAERKL
jgi:hypothetical protein